MKKVMILGASNLQIPGIIRAKTMGIETIVVDYNPKAVGFKYADVKCIESTIDIEAIERVAREYKPDGIMTLASDMPMLTVATVSKALGLPSISIDSASKATNKAKMRIVLQEYNVPIPKFHIINNFDEYKLAIENFNNRFIVKPIDNSGSRGIFMVKNTSQVDLAYEYSRKYSKIGQVLVEEYMDGPEVSVETFTNNGKTLILSITDKLTTGDPYFVEMGHSQPSQHDNGVIVKVEEVAKMAVNAVGIDMGPAHVEIKITNEGPKVVEIGARMGGDFITTHLLPLSTGIDMVKATIKQAIGEEPILNSTIQMASAIRFIQCPIGKIISIKGLEEAKKQKGVIEINITKNIGDNVIDIKSSNDRIGYVITQAKTPQEAILNCQKVIKSIIICVEV